MKAPLKSIFVKPLLTAALLAAAHAAAAQGYQQINLVTNDQSVNKAAQTDPNLVNPWGISYGPTGPFWVSNNGTDTSTLYNGAGTPLSLVVKIPSSNPVLGPTGQVFNGSSDFSGKNFLFASEDGTLSGWKSGTDGTQAVVVVNNAAKSASYTGIAISGHDLFAANSATGGGLDVFSSTFGAIGTYNDANAAGSTPFNVQNIDGTLYVPYVGAGGNFLDTFDPATDTFTRLVTGGELQGAWGLAQAPTGFGAFGGDLLVGNLFDGKINAYDPITGAFRGGLTDSAGNALVNPGLWGLTFGNGGRAGATDTLYFAAGGANQQSGLFGSIAPAAVPEASTTISLGLLLVLGGLAVAVRRKKAAAH